MIDPDDHGVWVAHFGDTLLSEAGSGAGGELRVESQESRAGTPATNSVVAATAEEASDSEEQESDNDEQEGDSEGQGEDNDEQGDIDEQDGEDGEEDGDGQDQDGNGDEQGDIDENDGEDEDQDDDGDSQPAAIRTQRLSTDLLASSPAFAADISELRAASRQTAGRVSSVNGRGSEQRQDDALVAWLASRTTGGDASDLDGIDSVSGGEGSAWSGDRRTTDESVFDEVDAVFDELLAGAASVLA